MIHSPMWSSLIVLFIINVFCMMVCKHRSTRVRKLEESPLEDSLHFLTDSQSQMMKQMNDWLPFISLFITIMFCRKNNLFSLIRNGLVFGIYKFAIASATRLPPATRVGNDREILFIPISTWVDYGISGHTGWCVLMWLHARKSASSIVENILAVIAVITSFSMTFSKDHYTLDVLVAWPVAYAIYSISERGI